MTGFQQPLKPHPYETIIRIASLSGLCLLLVLAIGALTLTPWLWVAFGLLAVGALLFSTKVALWHPRVPAQQPILLMLHSVSDEVIDPTCPNNSLRPHELEQLILSLQHAGYVFLTMDEVLANPQPRAVLLTFDDGYVDNYTNLFPILQRTGAKATCYITNRGETDPVFLTPAQVQEMQASGLVTFGGHTANHTKLDEVPLEVATREIAENVTWLTKVLGHAPRSFAYPCGGRTPEVIEVVKYQGYETAVTMDKKMRPIAENPYLIHRQIIPRGKTPWQAYALATRGRYKI